MGGGDLNLKKTWHPGTFKNQEKIWKLEQKVIDEKKKLEQLKKELQEERDREELERLRTGKRKKENERLEWMYSQGITANSDTIAQEKEDYLLGRKRIETVGDTMTHEQLQSNYQAGKNSIYGIQANTTRDFQNKVREDPLLLFRKQEQAALEAMMNNPLKVKDITEGSGVKKKKKHRERRSKERSPRYSDERISYKITSRRSRERSPRYSDERISHKSTSRRSRERSPRYSDERISYKSTKRRSWERLPEDQSYKRDY